MDLYKEVAGDILDAELQEQVRMSMAEISRLHLQDIESARSFYERVIDNDPENEQALNALEEIYAQTESWEPLLAIYQSRADILADSVDLRRSYLARAAGLCEPLVARYETPSPARDLPATFIASARRAPAA